MGCLFQEAHRDVVYFNTQKIYLEVYQNKLIIKTVYIQVSIIHINILDGQL